MLTILALTSLAFHALWWSGNLYEAMVIAPAWLRSWRRGQAPVRIDPRIYYMVAGPATPVAVAAAGVAYFQSSSAGVWLAAAAAASITAVGVTGYLVATINLELFFRDPPPPATRGFALMRCWAALNSIRLLPVTVVLGTTARACWELAHF